MFDKCKVIFVGDLNNPSRFVLIHFRPQLIATHSRGLKYNISRMIKLIRQTSNNFILPIFYCFAMEYCLLYLINAY